MIFDSSKVYLFLTFPISSVFIVLVSKVISNGATKVPSSSYPPDLRCKAGIKLFEVRKDFEGCTNQVTGFTKCNQVVNRDFLYKRYDFLQLVVLFVEAFL